MKQYLAETVNSLMIDTADDSYTIKWNYRVVTPSDARKLYNEAVQKFGEGVEMSMSAQRLVRLDFDIDALRKFYAENP